MTVRKRTWRDKEALQHVWELPQPAVDWLFSRSDVMVSHGCAQSLASRRVFPGHHRCQRQRHGPQPTYVLGLVLASRHQDHDIATERNQR